MNWCQYGTADLISYIIKYDVQLDPAHDPILRHYQRVPWSAFITPENAHLSHPEAVSLLDGMLIYDHQKRLTAKEAMAHPYFAPVRAAIANAAAAPDTKSQAAQ